MDGGPSEIEATKIADVSVTTEETDNVTENPDSHPESVSITSLSSTVVEASDAATEEGVSNQNLAQAEAAGSLSVPEVSQPKQLVTEAFESTVDMEGIVTNISESKSED